jgi:pyridoxine 5-phosphate synthase
MTNLSVNVNKIAWLRNAREGGRPNLVELSKNIINAGANGITVHPRPDLRHIRPQDVIELRKLTASCAIELNIEGNPFSEPSDIYPGFMSLIRELKPEQCTFVPDNDHQLTSDHGWDLSSDNNDLKDCINEANELNIRVSLFMDPDNQQIQKAKELGADRIELYTGPYAENFLNKERKKLNLLKYSEASLFAKSIDLGVNAGHDLDQINLKEFLHNVTVDEVSIGQALISDALNDGLDETVKKYLAICENKLS